MATETHVRGADLFDKCRDFTTAKEIIAKGIYPYFKPLSSESDTEVEVDGKRVIMIGSNNYLGLTTHPLVKEAAIAAIRKYGTGCTGSRFLNGTLKIHEELEGRLAAFLKREAALVFSTGFQANLGAISALGSKDDTIFIDRQDHASIVDGCRLSFAKTVKYRHNDVSDLERLLASSNGHGGKFVVVDGVFSMEGDLADLPGIVAASKRHGARVMVDEAHSLGVFGANDRGTVEHFGLEKEVDLVMGTFSKSFAAVGGVIASTADVVHFIKHNGRSMIFSASMPPGVVASVLAALGIIEKEPERRERLWAIVRKMKAGFQEMGFNTGHSDSPVIPIIVGEDQMAFRAWKALFDEGVFANSAVSPAVPPGMALLRTSYMATHTDAQLDRVLETFRKVGKSLGII